MSSGSSLNLQSFNVSTFNLQDFNIASLLRKLFYLGNQEKANTLARS
jgi:hypothetical protein